MTEKKVTRRTAAKATAVKKTVSKKVEAKAAELVLDAKNAGFKAGDVYQALAAEAKPLTLAEISAKANISREDALLGIGWLFKEGKIKNEENNKVALA